MTQAEADGLIDVLKRIIKTGYFHLPTVGNEEQIDLVSIFNKQDTFIIDVNNSSKIKPEKYALQLRYKKETVFLRLDFGGPPHRNPDDKVLPCPHMHIWRAERGGPHNTAWAYPLPVVFTKPEDFKRTLEEFLQFSNVTNADDLCIIAQTEAILEGGD